MNTIDLAGAAARGVAVANMPGVNTAAAAEHTVALLLAVLRRLPVYHAATATGAGWAVDPAVGDTTGEVAGRVVGLVGWGAIARRVARVLEAMDATVLHTSRTPDGPAWRPLDQLVAASDVVSLHVPLTPDTEGIISASELGLLEPRTWLVNVARGKHVVTDDLVVALREGTIGGAALDVTDPEPLPADHPLWSLPNCIITPHVGNTPEMAIPLLSERITTNVRRFADGEPLVGLVHHDLGY